MAKGIWAIVVEDSLSPAGCRLTTVLVRYPKFIQAELNTHRAFSRNSASSRALSVDQVLATVTDAPVIPTFRRQGPGMTAGEPLADLPQRVAETYWLVARDAACEVARALAALGVSKGHVNRLLEPFLYTYTLITATDWDNFTALRASDLAQPEMATLAYAVLDALNASQPTPVAAGDWHLPMAYGLDGLSADTVRLVAAARCARLSYAMLAHDRPVAADLRLAHRLIRDGHWSPFEHIARAEADDRPRANFRGWTQFRHVINPGGTDVRCDVRLRKETPWPSS